MADYTQAWRLADPWQAAGRIKVNEIGLAEEFVSKHAFSNSPIFNEFIRPYGDDTLYCMGGSFATPWGTGALAVHRGAGGKAFEPGDIDRLLPYSQEIGRLFKVKGELAAARRDGANARAILDSLAYAIIVVTPHAKVLSVNRAADRVLRRGDGLAVRKGVLGLARGSNAALHAALQRAASAEGQVAHSQVVARPPDRTPYLITICPMPRAGHLMILFRDPDVEDVSLMGRLRGLFGLTLAEAAVAADLAKGASPADIAVRRGVGHNTLKTQLTAIMGKMNCHRQAEIAAIVAALPAIR